MYASHCLLAIGLGVLWRSQREPVVKEVPVYRWKEVPCEQAPLQIASCWETEARAIAALCVCIAATALLVGYRCRGDRRPALRARRVLANGSRGGN